MKGAQCASGVTAVDSRTCRSPTSADEAARLDQISALCATAFEAARELVAVVDGRYKALFDTIRRAVLDSKAAAGIAQGAAPHRRQPGGSRKAPYKLFGTTSRVMNGELYYPFF